MRKVLIVVFCLAFVFSMAACNQKEAKVDESAPDIVIDDDGTDGGDAGDADEGEKWESAEYPISEKLCLSTTGIGKIFQDAGADGAESEFNCEVSGKVVASESGATFEECEHPEGFVYT